MATELLLLEDVNKLGRSGDIVKVKPGFARNFLVPSKKALILDENTRRLQERLKKEREKQAALDLEESKSMASHIEGIVISVSVKIDPEGHLYGSVSVPDIVRLLTEKGIEVEKKFVQLDHPIKKTGVHNILLKLKEGVEATFKLKVLPEEGSFIDESLVAEVTEEEESAEAGKAEAKEEDNSAEEAADSASSEENA